MRCTVTAVKSVSHGWGSRVAAEGEGRQAGWHLGRSAPGQHAVGEHRTAPHVAQGLSCFCKTWAKDGVCHVTWAADQALLVTVTCDDFY